METLNFCKVRSVKSPTRAHPEDAGIDFFIPDDLTLEEMHEKENITNDNLEYHFTPDGKYIKDILIKPNQSVLIPSGIKVKVPDGMMLQFTNKSGVASKKHLLVGANTVDIGYEGVCHINLHNVGTKTVRIEAGDKIVQGILIKVAFNQPAEVLNENVLYKGSTSDRQSGGFGSTGTK